MQDRERIQKEIETVKMQLSFADISAITAPESERENWEQKRSDLQNKLTELQKNLEECVVYDGENAAAIIDDATADAMLEQILAAGEPEPEPVIMPDLSAESADEVVHNAPDNIIFDLSGKTEERENAADETNEASVQAMIDEILMAGENNDYTVSEHKSQPEEESPIIAAMPSENGKEQEGQAAGLNATDKIIAEPAPVMQEPVMKEPTEQESPLSPWQPEDDRSEAMLKEILAATAERERTAERKPEPAASEPIAITSDSPFVTASRLRTTEPIAYADITAPLFADDFAERLASVKVTGENDAELLLVIEKLKLEIETAYRRAQAMIAEAERVKEDAARIKLNAETERAMYAAETELQRGLRNQEEALRSAAERADKERIAEKIARRKAEITEIRNGLQDVKDSESAFALREKLFSVQLVLDDDERNSPEISYLLTKSLDDMTHALEISDLKRRIAAMVASSKKQSAQAAAKKKAAVKKAEAKKAAAKKAAAAKKKKAALAARRRHHGLHAAPRRTPPRR